MKIKIDQEKLAIILALIATIGTIAAIFGYQGYRLAKDHPVIIRTRAPENGNFQPNEVSLPAGKPALLEIQNPETVSHGFAIPSLHVGIQEIKPGHVERLELPALQAGTYEFFCSTWCTVNHMKMRGRITVE